MAEHAGRTQGAVVALDAALLDAKLSVPLPRTGEVSRAELIDAARTDDCRVVGITAPAGYGKTTLLVQWAQSEQRRVAWVSLDRFDDDPAVLLTVLASAYARISPESADLPADMSGLGVSVLGRAAPRLATAFRSSQVPFVVLVDDLHELRSPACHDVLGVVIAAIPPGSQLVATSRSEQPHLARLRASGDARELTARDLALDAAAAAAIFTQAQVPVTAELAATVTERTEGWPAGIRLAAAIASDGQGNGVHGDIGGHGGIGGPDDIGRDVPTISGDDRYVADYLYRESLAQLPETTRRFLRCTAVLDQMCAPLCDALVGESEAQQRLRDLDASGMFLVPLDRRRVWYRYHALFREFLLGELQRVDAGLVPKLHLRAADWYESNGSPALALEHLLHTPEQDRCVQLVTALTLPTYQAGHMSTVERWLAALGDAAIEGYPPLAVLAGWVAALTGDAAEAQRWAASVDAASFDLVPADGTASFASARAMLRSVMCAAGPEQAMIDATLAVETEPVWSRWRDQALALCAEAHLLAGDVDRAGDLFSQAAASARTPDNANVLVISRSELALLAMDRGDWAEAAEHLDVALAGVEARRMSDYAMCLLALAGAARLAVHRGDLDEGRRQLTRAMRARPTCTFALPYLAVRGRLQLAKVAWTIGDRTTARHLLREIDDILAHRPALGTLVDAVAAFRRLVTSGAERGATGGPPLTPAELRLLPYLQTHLTIGEIAKRLFVSRNTVSTQVGAIYRKLGVSSRHDAVEQATAVGLLGG